MICLFATNCLLLFSLHLFHPTNCYCFCFDIISVNRFDPTGSSTSRWESYCRKFLATKKWEFWCLDLMRLVKQVCVTTCLCVRFQFVFILKSILNCFDCKFFFVLVLMLCSLCSVHSNFVQAQIGSIGNNDTNSWI